MASSATWIVCAVLSVSAHLAVLGTGVADPPASGAPMDDRQEYAFPSGAGVLFFHVRPERAADFEAVVTRLSAALDRSTDPTRRQQAASWRVYRSAESPRDVVIYLFFFDPAVTGADYDPVKVLGEDAPAEVGSLYEQLRAAVVRVERMGLDKLR